MAIENNGVQATRSVPLDDFFDITTREGVASSVVQTAQLNISRGSQIRAARALLNWTIADLATATGMHRNTVRNWEARPKISRWQPRGDQFGPVRIQRAFAAAGVTFFRDPTPGVCFMPRRPPVPFEGDVDVIAS